MGAVVVVATFLLPIGVIYLARSQAFEDRMTAEFGEGSAGVVCILLLFAGLLALIGAALLTNAGVGVILALAISTLLVRLWRATEPEIDR